MWPESNTFQEHNIHNCTQLCIGHPPLLQVSFTVRVSEDFLCGLGKLHEIGHKAQNATFAPARAKLPIFSSVSKFWERLEVLQCNWRFLILEGLVVFQNCQLQEPVFWWSCLLNTPHLLLHHPDAHNISDSGFKIQPYRGLLIRGLYSSLLERNLPRRKINFSWWSLHWDPFGHSAQCRSLHSPSLFSAGWASPNCAPCW